MTRINVGIKPKELPDKLLLAELREIKRIPNIINSGRYNIINIPNKFKLGTGHVKFFYDKLEYLRKRYLKLRTEAIYRGFNVSDFSNAWDDVPIELLNDYIETDYDRKIIINRIRDRGFDIII
jgi:deoxyribonuclease (pyrimidine dimer)